MNPPAAPTPQSWLYIAATPFTGLGLFTERAFFPGDTAAVITGPERHFVSETLADALMNPNWIGIGRHRWIEPDYPFRHLNHSCEPNLGIRSERELVALRQIAAGEELTLDYAITEDELLWSMRCHCGNASCRRTVRSIQFLPEKVLHRYLPFVGPYFLAVHESARCDACFTAAQ